MLGLDTAKLHGGVKSLVVYNGFQVFLKSRHSQISGQDIYLVLEMQRKALKHGMDETRKQIKVV